MLTPSYKQDRARRAAHSTLWLFDTFEDLVLEAHDRIDAYVRFIFDRQLTIELAHKTLANLLNHTHGAR